MEILEIKRSGIMKKIKLNCAATMAPDLYLLTAAAALRDPTSPQSQFVLTVERL